jgi:hypothetical protein
MVETRHIYWLAGLLDGEAHFHAKSTGQPRIELSMSDLDTVTAVAQLMGASSIMPRRHFSKEWHSHYRAQWRCWVGGRRAIGWMLTLYSLMSQHRKEQIRVAVAAWRSKPAKVGRKYRVHS